MVTSEEEDSLEGLTARIGGLACGLVEQVEDGLPSALSNNR